MRFHDLKKYFWLFFGLFLLAVAVIIVYKTFDNFGVIIYFFANVIHLMTPFFVGAAIAFVLRGPCKRIEILLFKTNIKPVHKHRRGLAILSVYIIVIAAIALIMVAIIPQLANSISKFVEQFPTILKSTVDWINSFNLVQLDVDSVQSYLSNDVFSLQRLMSALDHQMVDRYAKSVMSVGSTVVDVFIGIIISVYILIERKHIKNVAKRFARLYIPEKIRYNIGYYTRTVVDFIDRYIGCQLLDAGIVFMLCLIALSIMKAEYASLIALMVGSFNLIPYFGAFIAVIISALITLVTNGFMSALVLVIVLIVIQQIDANIIQPRLVASSLSIKPLIVIFGVLIGGGLFGIIGMFLGVPLVALLSRIIEDVMEKKSISAEADIKASESDPE